MPHQNHWPKGQGLILSTLLTCGSFNKRRAVRREDREPLSLGKDTVSRFWAKVQRNSDENCWLWTAGKFPTGYGMFHVGRWPDGRVHTDYAHRVSYRIHNNEWPPVGLVVMHDCDEPACCNPSHLTLGTDADNLRDAVAKGRRHGGRRIFNDAKHRASNKYRLAGRA
jgi:hypothetical protein